MSLLLVVMAIGLGTCQDISLGARLTEHLVSRQGQPETHHPFTTPEYNAHSATQPKVSHYVTHAEVTQSSSTMPGEDAQSVKFRHKSENMGSSKSLEKGKIAPLPIKPEIGDKPEDQLRNFCLVVTMVVFVVFVVSFAAMSNSDRIRHVFDKVTGRKDFPIVTSGRTFADRTLMIDSD
ncbi:hypothetical protein AAMO2058_001538300 [Amorphochlora amoebiformis]